MKEKEEETGGGGGGREQGEGEIFKNIREVPTSLFYFGI